MHVALRSGCTYALSPDLLSKRRIRSVHGDRCWQMSVDARMRKPLQPSTPSDHFHRDSVESLFRIRCGSLCRLLQECEDTAATVPLDGVPLHPAEMLVVE